MDCKHNSHCHSNSNNNMCKKKTLINHGRCKSKPKKLQQSHIISHGNNRLINHSPKTIDYLNAMKKLSNAKLNNNQYQHHIKSGKQNKTIQTPRKEGANNSFEQNSQVYSTLQYQSNPNEYDQQCNILDEESKNRLMQSDNYNVQLKERIDYLEEELQHLKMTNPKGECNVDKVALFIDLVRKYCKKLFALVNLDNQTNTESSQTSTELIMTIEQFSKMVFNKQVDKLIYSPSISKALTHDSIDNCHQDSKEMKYHHTSREKDVELFISNYEENISKMKKENDDLVNLLNQKEKELLQAKNANSEEIVSVRRKLYEQMKRNDDIEKHIMCLKNVNRDLESKCLLLEEENNLIKRKVSKSNKRSYDEDNVGHNKHLNDKKAQKDRSDYIAHLESLLNKENSNHHANEKDLCPNNSDNHKEKLSDIINQSNINKDSERVNINNQYPLEKKSNKNDKETNKEDNDYKSILTSERPLKIKMEIEEIDKEIFELQNQLRLMLDKK